MRTRAAPERVRATLTALQVVPQRIVLTPSTGDYLGVTFTVQRLVQARVRESFWDPYWFNRNAVDPEFGRPWRPTWAGSMWKNASLMFLKASATPTLWRRWAL